MTRDDLAALYAGYIDCLNRRDWDRLGDFVHPEAEHDGRRFGLDGYRAMLEADVRAIPDLRFAVAFTVIEPPRIAARLDFDCHPAGALFGAQVNGRRVRFAENVVYEVEAGRIVRVWSVIDKAAVAAQAGA